MKLQWVYGLDSTWRLYDTTDRDFKVIAEVTHAGTHVWRSEMCEYENSFCSARSSTDTEYFGTESEAKAYAEVMAKLAVA